MLQCQIWGRGIGNASEWKTLTQGTRGKKRKTCRFIPASSFIPNYVLSVGDKFNDLDEFQMGSISGLVGFRQIISLVTLAFSNCAFPFSPWPLTHTRVAAKQTIYNEFQRVRIGGLCEEWCLFCFLIFSPKYFPSLCTSPKLPSICWKNKKSAIQCMSQVTE
jgi:hypothetical protein